MRNFPWLNTQNACEIYKNNVSRQNTIRFMPIREIDSDVRFFPPPASKQLTYKQIATFDPKSEKRERNLIYGTMHFAHFENAQDAHSAKAY